MSGKFDFEASEKQLQDIIKDIEDGALTMEQTLDAYKKGMQLIKKMNKYLDDMQGEITVLEGGAEKDLEVSENDV